MKESFERFNLQTKLEKAKNQHKKLDRGANKSGLKPDAKAEDLDCGINPKITCKQVIKSYCKIMGLKRKGMVLKIGGKCLRMGKTVNWLGELLQ